MLDPAFRPAAELARSLRLREIGCRELLEHQLTRVAAINPSLNAIVTLAEDTARKRADELDAELARGIVRGSLHGLPITIKDSIESAGIRTTCGARVYSDHIPKANAPALQRLIDAGANVFGKTNTPAFANDVQTYNALFGATLNPWDRARTAGGRLVGRRRCGGRRRIVGVRTRQRHRRLDPDSCA